MNGFLKSGFLLGLGAAAAGKEKLEETIMKLVEKGTMTQTEADTLFDGLIKKGESKTGEWNKEFREIARAQFKELGFVTREELDAIQLQLDMVQEELSRLREENKNVELNEQNQTKEENEILKEADE